MTHAQPQPAQTQHLVVLDRGTAVMPALLEAVRQRGIRTGSISGIGAFERTMLGFYDVETREYHRREVPPPMEVVSFLGNITEFDGEPFIHAHIALGAPDFQLLGGHFFDAVVAVTGEFMITAHAEVASRAFDEATQLKLIAPPHGR